MRSYLSNHFELQRAQKELENARSRIMFLENLQLGLMGKLQKCVSPIAGSSSQPDIRTYTDGYRTLVVVWDDNLGRGRIAVTENEPSSA